MSPKQFHPKEEQNDTGSYDRTPPKINNHRLPPSSSAGSSTTPNSQPPRRPVIIYTHSPKVIHTHPRDFMALVQKLTGYTPPPEDTPPGNQDRRHPHGQGNNNNIMEDNDSTASVVTEEHGSSVNDINHQVNSCFVDGGVTVAPPPYRAAAAGFDPYFNPSPVFPANPADYLGNTPGHHQVAFYNLDSMFMNRNSLSNSSSSLRVLRDYPDI